MAAKKEKAVGSVKSEVGSGKPQTTNRKPQTSQSELISALKKAGHTIEGFSRQGECLIVRLLPVDRTNEEGGFVAKDVCDAAGLQADCRVYAAIPHNLLFLTVNLPEDRGQKTAPNASDPNASEPEA